MLEHISYNISSECKHVRSQLSPGRHRSSAWLWRADWNNWTSLLHLLQTPRAESESGGTAGIWEDMTSIYGVTIITCIVYWRDPSLFLKFCCDITLITHQSDAEYCNMNVNMSIHSYWWWWWWWYLFTALIMWAKQCLDSHWSYLIYLRYDFWLICVL